MSWSGCGVLAVVVVKALLEHLRNALAHHPHGVDGVDQRLGLIALELGRVVRVALKVTGLKDGPPRP